MNEKLVLIGAGSAAFTRGLVVDVINHGWSGELALVDTNSEALAVAHGLVRKYLDASGAPIMLSASVDRRDVLPGATVVITTIGVGSRRAWEQDVFIPRKYGIYQPVGDTVMPGGTSRALRMIPPMVDIARDVLDLCPDALFFNYANPMSPVCRGVRKATDANIVGLCHGVPHVINMLSWYLGVEANRFNCTAVGINHLTWFTKILLDGEDAMPMLRAVARAKLGRSVSTDKLPPTPAGANLDADCDPFTWELVDLFGAFPAVMDRHVVEFFGHMFGGEGAYFGQTLGSEENFSFEGTIAGGDACFEAMKELAFSPDPMTKDDFAKIGGEQEQAIEMIEAIRNDAKRVYSANLPNVGQIPNLPADAVVECPCYFDAAGVHPVFTDPMPAALLGTLASRFQWVETVVESAFEGSRDKFVQALLLDGACSSVDQAAHLADELLEAQAEHLPNFA